MADGADTVVDVVPETTTRSRPTSTTLVPLFELARGGMGKIEIAARRGPGFERLYAMKRLLPEVAADAEARRMFLDEGRIAGLIRHSNVVSVLDVGQDEHGPYLLMDYVEGISLANLLAKPSVGALPIDECLYVVRAIAEALHAAHELRHHDGTLLALIHRDVSPANVLVGVGGEIWLTDFGIARTLTNDHRTRTGVLKGKFGYMAPEQLRFEELDRRSDLFSLGVLTYELLSGMRLYKDPDARVTAQRILHEAPPDVSECRRDAPDDLTRLVFELLSKQPGDRPATAQDVASAVGEIARSNDLDLAEARLAIGRLVREHFGEELDRRRRRVLDALAERSAAEERAKRRDRFRRVGIAAALVLIALLVAGSFAALQIAGPDAGEAVAAPVAAPPPGTPPVEIASEQGAPPEPQAADEPLSRTRGDPTPGPSHSTSLRGSGADEPASSRTRRRARARMTTQPEPAPAKTDSNGRWIPLAP